MRLCNHCWISVGINLTLMHNIGEVVWIRRVSDPSSPVPCKGRGTPRFLAGADFFG